MAQRTNPARREKRQVEAAARQAERDTETPQQQLAALDARFGEGQGATRERARLEKQIAKASKRSA